MICKEVLIIMKKNQKDILLQDWLDTWYEIYAKPFVKNQHWFLTNATFVFISSHISEISNCVILTR